MISCETVIQIKFFIKCKNLKFYTYIKFYLLIVQIKFFASVKSQDFTFIKHFICTICKCKILKFYIYKKIYFVIVFTLHYRISQESCVGVK